MLTVVAGSTTTRNLVSPQLSKCRKIRGPVFSTRTRVEPSIPDRENRQTRPLGQRLEAGRSQGSPSAKGSCCVQAVRAEGLPSLRLALLKLGRHLRLHHNQGPCRSPLPHSTESATLAKARLRERPRRHPQLPPLHQKNPPTARCTTLRGNQAGN